MPPVAKDREFRLAAAGARRILCPQAPLARWLTDDQSSTPHAQASTPQGGALVCLVDPHGPNKQTLSALAPRARSRPLHPPPSFRVLVEQPSTCLAFAFGASSGSFRWARNLGVRRSHALVSSNKGRMNPGRDDLVWHPFTLILTFRLVVELRRELFEPSQTLWNLLFALMYVAVVGCSSPRLFVMR